MHNEDGTTDDFNSPVPGWEAATETEFRAAEIARYKREGTKLPAWLS